MIVKIRTEWKDPSATKWIFYDGFVKVSVKGPLNPKDVDLKKSDYDAYWIEENDEKLIVLIGRYADGNEFSLVARHGFAYLLNDNGKTIERL